MWQVASHFWTSAMTVNCSTSSAAWCSTKEAIDGKHEFNVTGDPANQCVAFNVTLRQLRRVQCDEKLNFACEVILLKGNVCLNDFMLNKIS